MINNNTIILLLLEKEEKEDRALKMTIEKYKNVDRSFGNVFIFFMRKIKCLAYDSHEHKAI